MKWLILVIGFTLLPCSSPMPADYSAAGMRVYGAQHRLALIEHYFMQGYEGKEIVILLGLCHNIFISLRQLKRLLQRLNFGRRRDYAPIAEVEAAVRLELRGSGQNVGYRLMWHRLNYMYGLRVTQNTVMRLLRNIDPDGVSRRTAHRLQRRLFSCPGPNHTVHIDGYDKLKPYGIAIHGAIDGFSRRVLWLKAAHTNNNPQIIAKFYLDFVRHSNGVPLIIRADRGTENCNVRLLHTALRWYHGDNFARESSFRYGRSSSNQRIEAWWSQMKRMCMRFWINMFKDIRDEGLFDNSDPLHVECLRFCFIPVIQKELDNIAIQWNQHRIRSQRESECPFGKPDLMYYIPEAYDAIDHKQPLDYPEDELLEVERGYCSALPPYGCHEAFTNVITELFGDVDRFRLPDNPSEALQLYVDLVDILKLAATE